VAFAALIKWVDRLNNNHLLKPIGNVQTAEAEANFSTALERSDMAA